MSNSSSDAEIARGARLVLLGVGAAPIIANLLTLLVGWRWVASNGTLHIQVWFVRIAVIRAVIMLPIIAGVWALAPGWSLRSAVARVGAIIGVAACWVDAFMLHMFSRPPPEVANGTGDVATQFLADSELASGHLRPVLTAVMYVAIAITCAFIAIQARRKVLAGFAIVTALVAAGQIAATSTSWNNTPVLEPLSWLVTVICVWRTAASARKADEAARRAALDAPEASTESAA